MVNKSRITGGDIGTLDIEGVEREGYGCFEIIIDTSGDGVYSTLDRDLNGGPVWTAMRSLDDGSRDINRTAVFRFPDTSSRPDQRYLLFGRYLEQEDRYLARASWAAPNLVFGDVYRKNYW